MSSSGTALKPRDTKRDLTGLTRDSTVQQQGTVQAEVAGWACKPVLATCVQPMHCKATHELGTMTGEQGLLCWTADTSPPRYSNGKVPESQSRVCQAHLPPLLAVSEH